jgi:hypothetical protein
VVELRNCSGNFTDSPMVFHPEALYRRRGVIRRRTGAPHTRGAWPGAGPRPLCVWAASGPLRLSFGPLEASRKNKTSGTCFIQFREYFLCSFSKTQKQQNIGNWHCDILSIG